MHSLRTELRYFAAVALINQALFKAIHPITESPIAFASTVWSFCRKGGFNDPSPSKLLSLMTSQSLHLTPQNTGQPPAMARP